MEKSAINKTCDICFRIACKKCDWVATDEEVELVQKEILKECPKCGWKPGNQIGISISVDQ